MADYTSPKPVDPIWYQPNAWIRIECGCGRREVTRLARFAKERRIDERMLIHRMISRLRCAECGARPRFAEVTRRPSGNR